MATTAVLAGKVEVVVTDVPRFFQWKVGRHTVTIKSADFVGLTPVDVVRRVQAMRSWSIVSLYTLNGSRLTGADPSNIKLKAGDKLELIDP